MGKEILEDYPDFINDYYKWHDKMEEGAAFSVVSPRYLARAGPPTLTIFSGKPL